MEKKSFKRFLKRGNKIQRKGKKSEREIELKYFLRGESCLLDGCLKIVNPFSMDIYHFPVDVHFHPAAIYQGRQTGRKEAWLQGR